MKVMVGRVGRAHGVSGEVSVLVSTDDPEGRYAPGSVLETDPVDRGPLVIEDARRHHGRLLVRFAGVSDRGAAEALAGTRLLAESGDARPTGDPEDYWDHELVGLAVLDPSSRPLGEVVDVVHGPGGEHLVVRLSDGRDALVPFVRAIVPVVDVATGCLVVDAPEGLWDL